MDPIQRIEELERQVAELSRVVRQLASERNGATSPAEETGVTSPILHPSSFILEKVLGGEVGESLETRIGGIWLSRVAVVLAMTCVALGARLTLYSDMLAPVHKLGIFYAASAVAVTYGVLVRKNRNFFAQTLLGAGLAGVYFTTYAAFFVEGMRVSGDNTLAIASLAACLLLLIGVCHGRRSQTVTGISLFLVYYTVIASCMDGGNAENLYYALLTCAILAATALAFHAAHRWILFTWAALIATYLTYMYFLLSKPVGLAMSDRDYFWISNGFLALCYVLFACAGILDARKTGEYRRGVAQMAGVNSFVFIALGWIAVRQNYPAFEWAFRFGLAACLVGFAALSELTGPRRNYLSQIYIAKAIVMFTLALQAYLSGETLMVAISLECLALAFSYKRSGTVVFKVLGLLLLFVSFVGCLAHVRSADGAVLAGYEIPSNWFCCLGSSIVFVIVAWFYERFVRRVKPGDRIVPSQWFLADTFLDLRSATAALLYAAAASLVLLSITILDHGQDPKLPYWLGMEGMGMALAGLLLRTPQVQVGGVLIVIASHVSYHTFLLMGKPGFEQQPHYVAYTVLIALFTYVGAYLWERYLARIQGGKAWEHHAVAALPYLAATFMLTTLLGRQLAGIDAPAAQNALGAVLLCVGVLTRYGGVKASGIFAFGIGTGTLYAGLCVFQDRYAAHALFLPYFGIVLATYAVGERLFVVLQRQERTPSKGENALRTALVLVATAMGVIGLNRYAQVQHLTYYWLALAIINVALGALFRESRYRWAGMALFLAAIVRAFAFDLRELSPMLQFLSFAALSVPLLVVSWAYSRHRQRVLDRASPPTGKDIPTDG